MRWSQPEPSSLRSTSWPALAKEAEAVDEIKRKQRFTVVIGNPPYKSVSLNRGAWIRKLVDDYLQLPNGPMQERGNRNQLQDDYVKFYRLAHKLTRTIGIVGLITNSSYLRGPWFRGMRYQLLRTFRAIRILDLHGAQSHSLDSRERDQNVFEITTSVAIVLLRTRSSEAPKDKLGYAEIVGPRQAKYDFLRSHSVLTVASQELTPGQDNQWRLLPHDSTGQEEWSHWLPLPEFFNAWGAGVLTNRNGLAVDADRQVLMQKICRFADPCHSRLSRRKGLPVLVKLPMEYGARTKGLRISRGSGLGGTVHISPLRCSLDLLAQEHCIQHAWRQDGGLSPTAAAGWPHVQPQYEAQLLLECVRLLATSGTVTVWKRRTSPLSTLQELRVWLVPRLDLTCLPELQMLWPRVGCVSNKRPMVTW